MTLSIRSVTKNYGLNKPILFDSNFTVDKGSVIGILGRNGIGKSTLLRSLAQMEPIQKGEILWEGNWLTKEDVSFVNLSDYYYKQKTLETVLNEFQLLFKDFDIEKTKQLVADLGISLTEKVTQLSNGMRQKFEIALTLGITVPIFLFDEPFSHLDYSSRNEIKQMIQDSVSEKNMILFTTNILENMDMLMSDVLIFTNQYQIASYNLEEIREVNNQSLKQLYMEVTQ